MTDFTIRKATIEDLSAVLSLYGQSDIDDGRVLDLEKAKVIFQLMNSYPSYQLFVASSGDHIIGTYTLIILDNLAHEGARSALVEAVVVLSECRGKGIGKTMMKHAMALSRESKCYKLALSSNMIRKQAHEFYKGLGFEQHGFSFVVKLRE